MNEPDRTGRHLDQHIASVIAKAGISRSARQLRWREAVLEARMSYSRVRDYRSPPIMEYRTVKREIHEMLRTVIEGRLTVICTPLSVQLEKIETSIEIFKILASSSGRGGPESYAPKSYRKAMHFSTGTPPL